MNLRRVMCIPAPILRQIDPGNQPPAVELSPARNDVDRLDAAAVTAGRLGDDVADDRIRPMAAGDDAADQDAGIGVPLDVDGAEAARQRAAHLRPAVSPAGALLLDDLEVVLADSGVLGDGVADTRPDGT